MTQENDPRIKKLLEAYGQDGPNGLIRAIGKNPQIVDELIRDYLCVNPDEFRNFELGIQKQRDEITIIHCRYGERSNFECESGCPFFTKTLEQDIIPKYRRHVISSIKEGVSPFKLRIFMVNFDVHKQLSEKDYKDALNDPDDSIYQCDFVRSFLGRYEIKRDYLP